MKPLILFLSGREKSYIRNRVLLKALKRNFSVLTFNGTASTTLGRMIRELFEFLAYHPKYDVCFVGFYAQPIALALSVLQRNPLIVDAYVSTYETFYEDRGYRHPSLIKRFVRWLDSQSFRVATKVITDTKSHAYYLSKEFGLSFTKLLHIYVGSDEEIFFPRETIPASRSFDVFYYCSFLPLHGVEVVLETAALLKKRTEIRFILGGYGPLWQKMRGMASRLKLDNVTFVGWIPLDQLPGFISNASVCLGGHFSSNPKAGRVISTKTFQFIAMKKPTIVGDSPAIRELFTPGKHVYAVPMNEPRALARAIEFLVDNPDARKRIAYNGYELFKRFLTTEAIAEKLKTVVEEVICGSAS